MAKESVPNENVVDVLRARLQEQGYKLTPKKPFGAHGADIIAEKNGEKIVGEVIGYKASGPARRSDLAVAFWVALGRVDEYPGAKVVIAIPSQFERGFGARLDSRRGAWGRIGKAFPELEVWLVDVRGRDYERRAWSQFLTEG